ncbi:MAG: (2Fe-2S) ferredoxin domain-containing protein [Proteobacteria bacterium]|nr:(2Fe-2S) ferredoxin domain-containing protein [Pseudomonadota bacterium]
MIIEKNGYDLHVLICTNEKEKGQSCGPKGGQEIVDHLKAWIKEQGFRGWIRVNRSGCLGKCESGIACAAYPKGEWVLKAAPTDLPAIEGWIRSLAAEISPS